MNKQEKKHSRSVSFLIISLLLHIFLLLLSLIYDQPSRPWEVIQVAKPKEEPLIFVDIDEVDLLKSQGSVVEQNNEKVDKPKKDAKYLSDRNQVVEKETRAAKHGEFQNSPSQKSSQPPPAAAQSSAAVATTSVAPKMEETLKTYDNGDMVVKKQDKPKKAKTFSDLRPNSMAEMSQTAENSQSQTNDYLKEVAISAENQLNTKEFLYYSYFNRIKKKLRQHWEPMVHAKVRSLVMKGRQPASASGAKTTRCVITLDDHGGLTRVQVLTTSGLEDLDDAALEALKAAAPFPNPPNDLITDGLVRINWDFILET